MDLLKLKHDVDDYINCDKPYTINKIAYSKVSTINFKLQCIVLRIICYHNSTVLGVHTLLVYSIDDIKPKAIFLKYYPKLVL